MWRLKCGESERVMHNKKSMKKFYERKKMLEIILLINLHRDLWDDERKIMKKESLLRPIH